MSAGVVAGCGCSCGLGGGFGGGEGVVRGGEERKRDERREKREGGDPSERRDERGACGSHIRIIFGLKCDVIVPPFLQFWWFYYMFTLFEKLNFYFPNLS